MRVIRGLHNLTASSRGCVATIGNFDGVHRGHQAILQQCREHAARLGGPLTVVVFEPQPREFFAGDQAPPRLTRLREKVRLLGHHGAEQVLCLPFNDALRSLTGREFIDQVLIDGLNVKHLVVGDDFRFGCDRRGDFTLLEEVGREQGFGVEHTRTFTVDDERVSSSRVRTLLASGNFTAAARLLGRPYSVDGRVVRDQQLGRTIGVPTANLPMLPQPLTLRGVYAVVGELENGERHLGVANVGFRPTVGATRPTLEVHLFDFSGDLYGQRMTVVPCARLRGEVKFDDIEALKAQIGRDQRQARRYFATAAAGNNATFPLASAPLGRETASSDSSLAGDSAEDNDG
ncbi:MULTISPECIES: bifunctional riboflavin kinase/FAD synthetase [Halomonadaceae]|uniref:bifunctional riboflavin kinase/FAD synthetase n=1 Tax=Halomonadaceae TaxID=28256 RepID=UPI000A286727|nr:MULTISPECIES: bifunctional riboflavin kinase/FAD synthetase [Halomonas]MCW4150595.1 bifunctional riboflavin kinase/FAD synthetase [Halomonas sp. 18H]MDR5887781.1 bifunctional riboflavin kinase/FAD synthetase [Halomonas janggokensis]QPL45635.1 bifunctional riboflavin kinase/FAD synthetase [Halomonas sp. A40-4]